jgi:hypothetical protein
MSKRITIWVTKYALTKGIYSVSAEIKGGMAVSGDRYPACFHGDGREWHRTESGAHRRADRMRTDKIAALRKQIAKLEAMKFDAAPSGGEARG